jgi:hypothetical protein
MRVLLAVLVVSSSALAEEGSQENWRDSWEADAGYYSIWNLGGFERGAQVEAKYDHFFARAFSFGARGGAFVGPWVLPYVGTHALLWFGPQSRSFLFKFGPTLRIVANNGIPINTLIFPVFGLEAGVRVKLPGEWFIEAPAEVGGVPGLVNYVHLGLGIGRTF